MSRVIKPPQTDRRALKWGCLCMPLHAFSITPGPAGHTEGRLFYSKLAGTGERGFSRLDSMLCMQKAQG